MKHLSHILMLSLLAGFMSCGGGGEDTAPPEEDKPEPEVIPNTLPTPSVSSTECPSGTMWTWDNMGEAYLLNYCTSCHSSALTGDARMSAPEGVDLDTRQNVQVWRANILAVVVGEGARMPPTKHVPANENLQFVNWLNCGAPTGTDHIE